MYIEILRLMSHGPGPAHFSKLDAIFLLPQVSNQVTAARQALWMFLPTGAADGSQWQQRSTGGCSTSGRDAPAHSRSRPRTNAGQQQQQQQSTLPMLASACPGWVCYAEKTHGEYVLPYISTTKSPQAVLGSLVKGPWATKLGQPPHAVYHCAVMPCYDKKLEAAREDFRVPGQAPLLSRLDYLFAGLTWFPWRSWYPKQ